MGLFVLGAGAALMVALPRPLAGDIIRYHASEGAINQINQRTTDDPELGRQ